MNWTVLKLSIINKIVSWIDVKLGWIRQVSSGLAVKLDGSPLTLVCLLFTWKFY